MSQGESLDELLVNVREAVKGCLSVDVSDIPVSETDKVMEIAPGTAARTFDTAQDRPIRETPARHEENEELRELLKIKIGSDDPLFTAPPASVPLPYPHPARPAR